MFSILPVYYFYNHDKAVFSDNALTIGEYLGHTRISHRFVLETVLFNYPLFNSSIFDGISLVPQIRS